MWVHYPSLDDEYHIQAPWYVHLALSPLQGFLWPLGSTRTWAINPPFDFIMWYMPEVLWIGLNESLPNCSGTHRVTNWWFLSSFLNLCPKEMALPVCILSIGGLMDSLSATWFFVLDFCNLPLCPSRSWQLCNIIFWALAGPVFELNCYVLFKHSGVARAKEQRS